MEINSTMFREYDIRGRIDRNDELTPEAIEAIGKGFAVFLKRRAITEAVVGCDGRAYSARVKDITIKALLASGVQVIDLGVVLVPVFYFSQYFLKKKGGVMITASHNPWGWSGFKHAYDYSTTFVPQDVAELREIIERGEFQEGSGTYDIHPTIIEDYTNDILSRVKLARPLRVLVDTGNGTAGPIVPEILRRAGCTVVEQYTAVAGETRHHHANPSTLDMLHAMASGTRGSGADIGLGWDDDGDRLGAVDEKGEIIWPDRILILLARLILAKKPGGKVVFDVKCTQALPEDIKAHGGVPVMWKTGHSYIKAKGKEVGAVLAGERSGHIYVREGYYEFDDATFAGLKLLEYISRQGKSISQIIAEFPRYITSPVWHAPCPDDKKYNVIDRLTAELKAAYGPENVVDINGARVTLEDGWGLVRASSNVPALVLVFEAKSEEGVKRIEKVFRDKLLAFPEVGREWETG